MAHPAMSFAMFLFSLLMFGGLIFIIGITIAVIYKLLFTKDNIISKRILQKKVDTVLKNSSNNFYIEKIYGLTAIIDKDKKKITIL